MTEILAMSDLDTVIILCEKAISIAEQNLTGEHLNTKEKEISSKAQLRKRSKDST